MNGNHYKGNNFNLCQQSDEYFFGFIFRFKFKKIYKIIVTFI